MPLLSPRLKMGGWVRWQALRRRNCVRVGDVRTEDPPPAPSQNPEDDLAVLGEIVSVFLARHHAPPPAAVAAAAARGATVDSLARCVRRNVHVRAHYTRGGGGDRTAALVNPAQEHQVASGSVAIHATNSANTARKRVRHRQRRCGEGNAAVAHAHSPARTGAASRRSREAICWRASASVSGAAGSSSRRSEHTALGPQPRPTSTRRIHHARPPRGFTHRMAQNHG